MAAVWMMLPPFQTTVYLVPCEKRMIKFCYHIKDLHRINKRLIIL